MVKFLGKVLYYPPREIPILCMGLFSRFCVWPRQVPPIACRRCVAATMPYNPPILQTIFHSSAVTGCTDSREYFTSAIAASFLSALIAAIVTGVFSGLSALMSTQTNLPVLSVGSG